MIRIRKNLSMWWGHYNTKEKICTLWTQVLSSSCNLELWGWGFERHPALVPVFFLQLWLHWESLSFRIFALMARLFHRQACILEPRIAKILQEWLSNSEARCLAKNAGTRAVCLFVGYWYTELSITDIYKILSRTGYCPKMHISIL